MADEEVKEGRYPKKQCCYFDKDGTLFIKIACAHHSAVDKIGISEG